LAPRCALSWTKREHRRSTCLGTLGSCLGLAFEQRCGRRCESNGGSSTCSATAISRAAILCRESAPLGQGNGASLFVDLPRDEMALPIELVVHLGMNRAELLQRLHTSKALLRLLASPKRLMRILCAIVETATDLVPIRDSYFNHRRGIRTKTVDDDDPWSAVFLHDPLEKLQRDSPVPS
jgi:hypothetical protein